VSGEARGVSRREAIRRLVGAGLVTAAGADLLEAFAPAGTRDDAPRFFDAREFRVVAEIAARIIPTDETPGAREARVEEWIDFFTAASDGARQRLYREGLRRLDELCHGGVAPGFLDADAAARDAALQRLAAEAPEFFEAVKGDTIVGFYTSEIGLKELDWGGQMFHAECPGCTHPEHLLAEPGVRPSGRPPAP